MSTADTSSHHRASTSGRSTCLADTQQHLKNILPTRDDDKAHRIPYAVHERVPHSPHSRFIGRVALRSLGSASDLAIPPSYFPATVSSPSTLVLELGYSFLHASWGRGFATEAVSAVLAACRGADRGVWGACEKVYLRAVVNVENGASLGVVRKSGMEDLGAWIWEGEEMWFAGEWRERTELRIWGGWIVE
jgi:RimJ/RimL family protein N-acetyltransferase